MPNNPLRLKIAYLYPDILQGYSDKMNVETFYLRSTWRDINVQVHCVNANEHIQSAKYDFYYIGGSNINNLELALENLKKNADELKIAAVSGVPILAVNCGYCLFGNFYQLHNRTQVEGLKIFDVDFIAGKNHHFGNIIGTCNFLKHKTVVGFENHGLLSYLKNSAVPFLILNKGKGNNFRDKTEGVRFNNVIGTNITSPILAQNPHFCDFLIATALRIKYRCRIPLVQLCDDIEWYSHSYLLNV